MFPFFVDTTNIPALNPAAEGEQDTRVKKLSRSNIDKSEVVGIVFQASRGVLFSWWSSSIWCRVGLKFDTHSL